MFTVSAMHSVAAGVPPLLEQSALQLEGIDRNERHLAINVIFRKKIDSARKNIYSANRWIDDRWIVRWRKLMMQIDCEWRVSL